MIHLDQDLASLNPDFAHSLVIFDEIFRQWQPHDGQIPILEEIFIRQTRSIFAECGRNFGKSDVLSAIYWLNAVVNSESDNYYFAPFMKQAREIMWASGRIQSFGPKAWIESINNTEMRISWATGSFLKLDGSDNTEAYRGVKVKKKGVVGYDEFKDFRPEFRVAMEPNVIDGFEFLIGTPPEVDGQFTEVADEFRDNPKKAYFNFPTAINPHISKDWLEGKRRELEKRGELDVWFREYEAKRVKGGKNSIFPMIHGYPVTPHVLVMREIARDRKKLQWFCIADPAAISVFGVLYVALNPYTRKVYFLDEVYETEQAKMTVSQIGQRIIATENELYEADEFNDVYDEAESWFYNEMGERFEKYFVPTSKASMDKDAGLSLIKDVLLRKLAVISDRCVKLVWEMEQYVKDAKGKVPKKNDHLIDCVRYFLHSSQYTLEGVAEPLPEKMRDNFRGARIEQDYPDLGEKDDGFQFQLLD